MYDHETGSLWGQVIGKAIDGPLTGVDLDLYPVTQTTWFAWRSSHPNTLALEKPVIAGTVYDKYNADTVRLGIHGRRMNRSVLPPKSKVIGFLLNGKAYAIPLDLLEKGGEQNIDTPDGDSLQIITDSAGLGVSLWHDQMDNATKGFTERRERVVTIQAFWFGWHNFHPETVILRP